MSNSTLEPGEATYGKRREPITSFAPRFFRTLAAGTVAGLIASFLAGGLGGRLVMRILAITSRPELNGAITDNGNRVNEFTLGGTVGLIGIVTLLGAVGGWGYILIRRWLPGTGWRKGIIYGAVLVLASSLVVIDPGNKDFAILRPQPLGVLLFLALGLGYGLIVAPVAERLDHFYARVPARLPWLVAFAPVLLFGLFLPVLPIIAAVFLLSWLLTRSEPLRRLWEGIAIDRAGRVLLAVVCAIALAAGSVRVSHIHPRDVRPSDFQPR